MVYELIAQSWFHILVEATHSEQVDLNVSSSLNESVDCWKGQGYWLCIFITLDQKEKKRMQRSLISVERPMTYEEALTWTPQFWLLREESCGFLGRMGQTCCLLLWGELGGVPGAFWKGRERSDPIWPGPSLRMHQPPWGSAWSILGVSSLQWLFLRSALATPLCPQSWSAPQQDISQLPPSLSLHFFLSRTSLPFPSQGTVGDISLLMLAYFRARKGELLLTCRMGVLMGKGG